MYIIDLLILFFFFFQAEDGIRDLIVTGVQTCALPISYAGSPTLPRSEFRSAASALSPLRGSRTSPGSAFEPCWRAPWPTTFRPPSPDSCSRKRNLELKLSDNRPLHREVEIRKTFLATRHGPAGYSEALKAVRYLRARWGSPPQVGIVLGSGLGEAARHFQAEKRIRYDSIPHFPRPTVAGHGGTLHLGRWGKASVAVLEGRMHLYEGYSPAEVVFPVRVLALSGAETLIFTCAAGGIAPKAAPGTFMVFSDHLNFQGVSPLAGPHDERTQFSRSESACGAA